MLIKAECFEPGPVQPPARQSANTDKPPVSNTIAFVMSPLFHGVHRQYGIMNFTRKFFSQGLKGIMNKYRITAMVASVAFAGILHAQAAQENIDSTPADNTPQQYTSDPKPLTETPVAAETTPAQALAQSNDKLLSEMKVYPSF
jgi:hypothetical protein